MGNVTQIKPSSERLVTDLRQLADDIESGKEQPSNIGICVLKSRTTRTTESIHVRHIGDQQSYSDAMGMLAFTQHLLFRSAGN